MKNLFVIFIFSTFYILQACKPGNTLKPDKPCIDGDENKYDTVKIGIQIWMKENLKTTSYNDGTPIQEVKENSIWGSTLYPRFCWRNNDTVYKNEYGALYNWAAVDSDSNGNKNVCPAGWHVPDTAEWNQLIAFLGGTQVAGGKMKLPDERYWLAPNVGADNSSGFSAKAAGYRTSNGYFNTLSTTTKYWSTLNYREPSSLALYLRYNYSIGSYAAPYKSEGHSIRCIKDKN